MSKGHTLVIPKTEEDYIFNLDDDTYTCLTLFAKKVALGIEKAIPWCFYWPDGYRGLEVPHTHIHLIPIQKEGDMSIANPKLKLTAEEMAEIAEKIRKNI